MRESVMDGTSTKKKRWLQQLQKTLLSFLLLFLFYLAVRDSLPEILHQLKAASPSLFLQILAAGSLYYILEGGIITAFANRSLPSGSGRKFPFREGIVCAFYCSFYKAATFGSGSGAAEIYFLCCKGAAVSQAAGICMLQYVMHKLSISLFAGLGLILNYNFMQRTYGSYTGLVAAGFLLTLLISAFLILLCKSRSFHKLVLKLLALVKKKCWKKLPLKAVSENLALLEASSSALLTDKKLIFTVTAANLLKLSCWFCIPFIVLRHQVSLRLMDSLSITSLMTALAGVIPTPAGIGSTEFMYTLLYLPVTNTAAAASSMLLYRFATFIFPALPGAVLALLVKKNGKISENMLP